MTHQHRAYAIIPSMNSKKNIALVAHDHKKNELLAWLTQHQLEIAKHTLYASGTTGKLISDTLSLPIHCLESGPLGGDLQIGALITERKIDILFFFWDPLEAQPHDPDVRALLRIAVLWNIPIACNQITADLIIQSRYMEQARSDAPPDVQHYRTRKL